MFKFELKLLHRYLTMIAFSQMIIRHCVTRIGPGGRWGRGHCWLICILLGFSRLLKTMNEQGWKRDKVCFTRLEFKPAVSMEDPSPWNVTHI